MGYHERRAVAEREQRASDERSVLAMRLADAIAEDGGLGERGEQRWQVTVDGSIVWRVRIEVRPGVVAVDGYAVRAPALRVHVERPRRPDEHALAADLRHALVAAIGRAHAQVRALARSLA